jgi:hypothetical protein
MGKKGALEIYERTSMAHELKQPIAAALTNAKTCVRWLRRDTPDVAEGCEAAFRMINDATRAAEVIDRVRSLYRRDTSDRELLDVNDLIREMITLLHDKADRNSISIRTELDSELPLITADRVQLQQVLMNLILNGIEAMKDANGELTITSKRTADTQLLVSVSDSGTGLLWKMSIAYSMPSSPPRRRAPAWVSPSVGGLSSLTEAVCGRLPMRNGARRFSSHCQSRWRRLPHRPRNIGIASMLFFIQWKSPLQSWIEPHKYVEWPPATQ